MTSLTDISTADLAAALTTDVDFNLELPDPEDDQLHDAEFDTQIERVWQICDRFDLQTDIWRGRIMRAVRDREKRGGDGRGTGFLNWLKQREISKSQAYGLIELANSADTLLAEGQLDPNSINNFSKNAFVETAKSAPEIQKLVADAAQKGDRITRREVKQLADEWTSMSSELLPDEVKEQAASGALPSRFLSPLVKELEKLPETHVTAIQEEIREAPNTDTVKAMTREAKSLAKYIDAAAQVQTLRKANLDLEMALEEALRLDCLGTAADLVKQATQMEQCVVKLFTTWKRLGKLADRLYVDTGASNPYLRSMLGTLDALSGEVLEVDLDDSGESSVRIRILGEE
ncbi:hypothetical protein [Picosynechococcus sp. PCC 8807]|uniref:hypothetical protein n=1 Tax=Picosynechococcus sp. PCC 8807 TaxID=195248 RepID=UPI0008108E01|nr:hypothetical protein [Picosynechococcus sp. PCC 8807]ANV90352.1 hypothetical protein AWQ24_06755 [Picosynechococcus sp. PCC 8807]